MQSCLASHGAILIKETGITLNHNPGPEDIIIIIRATWGTKFIFLGPRFSVHALWASQLMFGRVHPVVGSPSSQLSDNLSAEIRAQLKREALDV